MPVPATLGAASARGFGQSSNQSTTRSMFAQGEQGVWYDPQDFKPNWRRNLLTYTEQFDNAVWTQSGTVNISTNSTTAPDGTLTADTVTAAATTGAHRVVQVVTAESFTTSKTYSYYVYAKAGTTNYIQLGAPSNTFYCNFDLSAGVVGSSSGIISASITAAGNGWYKCAIIFNPSANTSGGADVFIVTTSSAEYQQSFTALGTESVYLWGAQLEFSSTASDYQKITDGVQDYYTYQTQPVLFQDQAGSIPVTAVEQPVRLMLDKSRGLALGSEICTDSGFDNPSAWSFGGSTPGWSVSNGVASVTQTAAGNRWLINGNYLTIGKTYKITVDATVTAGSFAPDISASAAGDATTSGKKQWIVTATTTTLQFIARPSFIGSIDNVSFKEIAGNHAYATADANRPTLSARYNLLTKTEQFDDAAWVKVSNNATVNPNIVSAPNGTLTADALLDTATNNIHYAVQTPSTSISNSTVVVSVYAKAATLNYVTVGVSDLSVGTTYAVAVFNLSNGTVSTTGASGTGYSVPSANIVGVGSGWYRCIVTCIIGTATSFLRGAIGVNKTGIITSSAGGMESYLGNGSGVYIWGADLRVSDFTKDLPAYQRVNTSTDYDTNGFPLYLAANGSSTAMQTNSIVFSSTDKMTVVAGVRKLIDSSDQVLYEFSATTASNTGTFSARPSYDGNVGTGAYWTMISKGSSASTSTTAASYISPISEVLSSQTSISTDQNTLRLNSLQLVSPSTDQGTGNYGNYPLYLFARNNGASNWFNGHFYGLVIRGAQTSDVQLARLENDMAVRTPGAETRFTPNDLFKSGEEGVWYDPSDFNPDWRTNLLTYSEDFENAVWTKSNASIQYNLLKYTEQFDNSVWSKGTGTPTITANSLVAPDGTTTADKLLASNTSGAQSIYQAVTATAVGYTYSVYAKAGEVTWLGLSFGSGATVDGAFFDLENGVIGTRVSGTGAKIENTGNGWFRCSINRLLTAASYNATIEIHNADNQGSWNSATTAGIYIWGSQFAIGDQPRVNLLTYTEDFSNAIWNKQTSVSIGAKVTAPNGTNTADTINWGSAANLAGIYYDVVSGLPTTSPSTKAFYVRADIAGGTVELTDAQATIGITTLTLSTSWQRIELTEVRPAGTSRPWLRKTASSPATIYVWGADLRPASYSASLPSYQKVVSATDYNTIGFESLVNAGDYTQTTSTSLPVKYTGPFGGQVAAKLIEDTANTEHRLRVVTISKSPSSTLTYSAYIKPSGRYVQLSMENSGTGIQSVFDVVAGTWSTIDAAGWTRLSTAVTPVGDGWYRCSISALTDTNATVNVRIELASTTTGGANQIYTGNGTSGILIYGAQLQRGSTVSTYQRITDVNSDFLRAYPNTTLYQDSTGTTPVTSVEQAVGLILDKSKNGIGSNGASRYNLLTYTEDFSNAVWNRSVVTITPDSITSPNGTLTADTIAASSSTAEAYIRYGTSQPVSTGITVSIYAKKNTVNFLRIRNLSISSTSSAEAWFNLNTGTKGTVGSGLTADITPAGNGWYKCSISGTTLASISFNLLDIAPATNDGSRAVIASDSIYIWGADLRLTSQAALTPTYQPITSSWYATIPGNHAFQATPGNRPTLSSKVNLLTKTEDFSDTTAWTPNVSCNVTGNSGINPLGINNSSLVTFSGTNGQIYRNSSSSPITVTPNTTYKMSVWMRVSTGTFKLKISTTDTTSWTISTVSPELTLTTDWQQFSLVFTTQSTQTTADFVIGSENKTPYLMPAIGSVYVWGADLRPASIGNNLPVYQRVNTSTDYDTVGFPVYLAANGSSTAMATNSINFSGTDKMTVVAGVRKLSDAFEANLVELSTNWVTNNGSFYLAAPSGVRNDFGYISKGTTAVGAGSGALLAPTSNVLTGQSAISTPLANLRVNGTQAATSAASQGTGNYGNYPLYLFARNNGAALLWFKGYCYGMIIRGAQSDTDTVTKIEDYINKKSGGLY